jgi:hypothetical protein
MADNILMDGCVLFEEKQHFCACLVWDVAKKFAMIEVGPDTVLPSEFRLISDKLFLDRMCKVIWCHGRQLGIRFAS